MRSTSLLPVAMLALAIAGCSSLTPARSEYRCDDGQRFAVSYAADGQSAILELAQMRFSLLGEPTGGEARRYRCEVLTLTRLGNVVELEVQDEKAYRNCREQR